MITELLSPVSSSSRLRRSYNAVIFASVCLALLSGAPFRLTVHLWHIHHTTFCRRCQPLALNHPKDFVLHGFGTVLFGKHVHLKNGASDPSGQGGAVILRHCTSLSSFVGFPRIAVCQPYSIVTRNALSPADSRTAFSLVFAITSVSPFRYSAWKVFQPSDTNIRTKWCKPKKYGVIAIWDLFNERNCKNARRTIDQM